MINYKEHWRIKIGNGKVYQCRFVRLNFIFFEVTISFVSLGFRKWDLRANIHSKNW